MKEKEENSKLENFISKSIQSLHDEPSEAVWEGLNSRLDAHGRGRKKRFVWWPFLAGLAGLGLVAFFTVSMIGLNRKLATLEHELQVQTSLNQQLKTDFRTCQTGQQHTEKRMQKLQSELAAAISVEQLQPARATYSPKNTNMAPPIFHKKNAVENKEKTTAPPSSAANETAILNEEKEEKNEPPMAKELAESVVPGGQKEGKENKPEIAKKMEENLPTESTPTTKIDPAHLPSKWDFGVVANHGQMDLVDFYFVDYLPQFGLSARMEITPNWQLMLGAAYAKGDFEIVVEDLPSTQVENVFEAFPNTETPSHLPGYSLAELDVDWQSIDFLMGVQHTWNTPSALSIYADAIARPSLHFSRDYKYKFDHPTNPNLRRHIQFSNLSKKFYPLNFELGAGFLFPVPWAKKLDAQLGFFYQPPLTNFGAEKIEHHVFGIKTGLWLR